MDIFGWISATALSSHRPRHLLPVCEYHIRISSSSFLGVDRIHWTNSSLDHSMHMLKRNVAKSMYVFFGITYLSWSEKFNEIIQQVFGIHLQLGLVSRTTDLTLAVHNWHISDSLSTKLLVRFVKWNALLWCLEYYSAGRSW